MNTSWGRVVHVRPAAAFLFAFMAAIFVQAHSLLQANLLRYGYRFDLKHLPLLTDFFNRFHAAGYILPAAAFILIFIRPSKAEKRGIADDAAFYSILLLSVFWVLLCLISWQLPGYYPIIEIK